MKKFIGIVAGLLAIVSIVAISLPSLLHAAGLHPEYAGVQVDLKGKRALIITTSHSVLNAPGETAGDPTGGFGSEMTEPYYEFQAGGMQVDIASSNGGEVPIFFFVFPPCRSIER